MTDQDGDPEQKSEDSEGHPHASTGAGRPGKKRDVFPPTQIEFISEMIEQGTEARPVLNENIMERYYLPLQVYFKGSRFYWLGDAEEVVHEFYVDRLSRKNYFVEWEKRGMRLRYWLITSFKHFLFEKSHRLQRERKLDVKVLSEEPPTEDRAEAEADREFARSVVAAACERAERECREQGLHLHWRLLMSRIEGKKYIDLEEEFRIEDGKARFMARTAREKFRAAIREIMQEDGVSFTDLDDEIRSLMSMFRTPRS